MGKIRWKALILCFVAVYLVAFVGSLFTAGNTNSRWYQENKPAITPPNYVFPIVWNFLFFLIALALYFSWVKSKNKRKIIVLFGINFILNILWSYFFFFLKNPKLAFIDLILLLASIVSLLVYIRKVDMKAFYLLLPYLLWVGFAGILNFLFI